MQQCFMQMIEMCACWLLEKNHPNKTINIFSDSQAAIVTLVSNSLISKVVLKFSHRVVLVSIPGHYIIPGTEAVDLKLRLGISLNLARKLISNQIDCKTLVL